MSSGTDSGGRQRPPLHPELGRRIERLADLYPSRKAAAEAGGISHDQLTRYMRGENVPSLLVAAKMAVDADVSLEWLATGKGEMLAATRPKDEKLVSEVLIASAIVAVEKYLEDNQLTCPPEKKAELILLLCEMYKSESNLSGSESSIGRMLRLVS